MDRIQKLKDDIKDKKSHLKKKMTVKKKKKNKYSRLPKRSMTSWLVDQEIRQLNYGKSRVEDV